jgi:hypothetical protein
MMARRFWYYMRTLFRNILSLKGVLAVLSSFGALWLCVEIADYFFKATTLPTLIQSFWWLFFTIGVITAAWICRPKLRVTEKLKNRDIEIEIVIGDLFSLQGAIVVGSNSTFDTRVSPELISEKSVQGQFTRRYYESEKLLDIELNAALDGISTEDLAGQRKGKNKRYPIGTVARLNPKDRMGYFIAIANINEHGVASGTFDALKESLAQLWQFVGQRGLKGTLLVPILGSGFTRLATQRQVIAQEIIKSFVAACSEKTFCEKLTIVLAENDVIKHQIDLQSLRDYLHHICMYTEVASSTSERLGTPIA